MPTRRKLDVGADGMADVLILTDPIPRQLSIVSWGANDMPATSWKSASDAAVALRTVPQSALIDVNSMTMQRVQGFVAETLDALNATVAEVLKTPLSSAERGSRTQALWVQAGARVAAFATAVTYPKLADVTKTYKTVGLQLPAPPDASTLQGELDRRHFMAGLEQASAAMTDTVISFMRDSGEFSSMTEGILSTFNEAGTVFASWAASMPAGVVGVPVIDTTQNASGSTSAQGVPSHTHSYSTGDEETGDSQGHTHPVKAGGVLFTGMAGKPPHRHAIPQSIAQPTTASKAGARNKKKDQIKLDKAMALLVELGAAEKPTSSEKTMITIADLQRLAGEDPVAFLSVFKSAIDATKTSHPEVAKKFMWGDTGVEQEDPMAILAALGGMSDGNALASLIASAVGGVDVGGKAEADNVQVAASMRAGLSKHIASELSLNAEGELAIAVKTLVSGSVAAAITESLKAVMNGQNAEQAAAAATPFGMDGFTVEDGVDPLAVEYPSASSLTDR